MLKTRTRRIHYRVNLNYTQNRLKTLNCPFFLYKTSKLHKIAKIIVKFIEYSY